MVPLSLFSVSGHLVWTLKACLLWLLGLLLPVHHLELLSDCSFPLLWYSQGASCPLDEVCSPADTLLGFRPKAESGQDCYSRSQVCPHPWGKHSELAHFFLLSYLQRCWTQVGNGSLGCSRYTYDEGIWGFLLEHSGFHARTRISWSACPISACLTRAKDSENPRWKRAMPLYQACSVHPVLPSVGLWCHHLKPLIRRN